MNNISIISIPPDKQIDLTIGGLFYQRLNKLFVDFADSHGRDNLLNALEKIKQQNAQTDDFAYNVETLMILIRDIEEKFKNSGYTKEIDIDSESIQQAIKDNLKQ